MNGRKPLQPQPRSLQEATGRLDALRHLTHADQLRASLRLARQPRLRPSALAGLQAALAMAIALPLFHLSPWSHLTGYAALGALAALFGRFAAPQRRNLIVFLAALCQTSAVVVMSLVSLLAVPTEFQLGLLAFSCGLFYFITVSGDFGPPGALIFVFAVGAAMAPVDSLHQVIERGVATGTVALLAVLICAATEGLRRAATLTRPHSHEAARPVAQRMLASGRIVVAAGIAAHLSHALGARFPTWAAMGSLAVTQGTHLHITMHRALQRTAGTAVGALAAWVILTQEPSVWSLIALLILLQFTTEVVIGTNYGVAQMLVTPMALLMTSLAVPAAAGAEMAAERVLDTLLGVSVVFAIAVLLSSLDERRALARLHPRSGEARDCSSSGVGRC